MYHNLPDNRSPKWNNVLHNCLDAKPQAKLTKTTTHSSKINPKEQTLTDTPATGKIKNLHVKNLHVSSPRHANCNVLGGYDYLL